MYKWNEDKNSIFKSQKGFSFDDILSKMKEDGVLNKYKHPNFEKYPNQYIYLLSH